MERTNQISPWSRTVDWTYNEHIVQRRVLSSSTVKSLKPIYLANPTCHLSPLSVSIDNDERTLKAFKTSAVSFIFRFFYFFFLQCSVLGYGEKDMEKKKVKEFWDFTLRMLLLLSEEYRTREIRISITGSCVDYKLHLAFVLSYTRDEKFKLSRV